MTNDHLNEIDNKLHHVKWMAEFASELVGHLDGSGAAEGHFHIPESEGNRLAFCCNDLLERVEELIGLLRKPA